MKQRHIGSELVNGLHRDLGGGGLVLGLVIMTPVIAYYLTVKTLSDHAASVRNRKPARARRATKTASSS